MALVLPASSLPSLSSFASPRKRNYTSPSPFQTVNPRPTKAPRLSSRSMRRTDSFLDMSDASLITSRASSTLSSSSQLNNHSSCAHDRAKEVQRERRRTPALERQRSCAPITTGIPDTHGIQMPLPSSPVSHNLTQDDGHHPPPSGSSAASVRLTSPLAPARTCPLTRPTFPRSKPKLDLHRKAVTTCMLQTPEGQRMLHMGPRLALSIATATKELENIVAATLDRDSDNDVTMADVSSTSSTSSTSSSSLSSSWVVIPNEDWEMVSCS